MAIFVTGDVHGGAEYGSSRFSSKSWPDGRTLSRDDVVVVAAALDPDALGLVPELAAAHGRDAGGKGKALVQDAFLSGVVADLARALLYECLA